MLLGDYADVPPPAEQYARAREVRRRLRVRPPKVAKALPYAFLVRLAEPERPRTPTPTPEITERWRVEDINASRIQIIARVVAEMFDLTVLDLRSARRSSAIVRARQVVMYVARHETGYSTPRIGSFLGGRDHSTVLHGITKIEQLLKTDADLADMIARIRIEAKARYEATRAVVEVK